MTTIPDDQLRAAFERFYTLESDKLNGFSTATKKLLGGGKLQDYSPHHIRHYGEFLVTLGGLKPCVLISHGTWEGFAKEIAECIQKVMDEFDLPSYGFELFEIKHTLKTSNNAHPGFQKGWVFYNKNHAVYPLVKKVFLTPSKKGVQLELDIGNALGYPMAGGLLAVSFMDRTESERQDCCCVTAYEYFCGHGQYKEQIKFFQDHADIFRKVGRQLVLDPSENPGLERYWSAHLAAQRQALLAAMFNRTF